MQSVFDLLNNNQFSKLVCGAGNEDCEFVKRLVYIYAKAGWKIFDISARVEILEAAKEGAKLAQKDDVSFCVSIGIKGDPHISKARVNSSKCITCGNCAKNCPNSAIYPPNIIDDKRCIGCGVCSKKCPTGSITMYEKDINAKEALPKLVEHGANILELHVTGYDMNDLYRKWQIINESKPSLASICIDRSSFGNKEVLSRLKEMLEYRADYTTIIQADGLPMSGVEDNFKTTLQAVAMAEIIQNAKLPAYLIVSGGTNSKTAELCRQCEIYPNGIALGSWARKIVSKYTAMPDFWENIDAQTEGVKFAAELLQAVFPV